MKVDIDPDSYVADLGAAEAKIVEIMKALVARVEVLILDEPTAALPEKDVAALFAVIRSLREAGVTVVYISHRLDEIFSIADRVSVLKDGQLVGTWPVARDRPRHSGPLDGGPGAHRHLSAAARRARDGRGGALRRGLRGANLAGVSFGLRAGEILGVGGMTGNGQREFLRCLFGAHPLDRGHDPFPGAGRCGSAPRGRPWTWAWASSPTTGATRA